MSRRWAFGGALLGALFGALAFAPAAWLAGAVQTHSDGRLLLADARGTVWSGSAVPVLSGGAGSRAATALPGRLHWSLGWEAGALALQLRHACCLHDTPVLHLRPGIGRLRVALPVAPDALGEWPAAWLTGLGTPWNTLQLAGMLRLSSPGLTLEWVQGRWRLEGQATLALDDLASRLSTLPTLGSYRLQLSGDAEGTARLALSTTDGPLQLQGQGQWAGAGLHFRGEARAEDGAERALDNLLNIIGRRQGARSLIAIG